MSKLDIPVFVHVPKTAGTTFRVAVEQYLGAGAILWDYGAESPVTSPVVRQYLYQEKDVDALRQAVARRCAASRSTTGCKAARRGRRTTTRCASSVR